MNREMRIQAKERTDPTKKMYVTAFFRTKSGPGAAINWKKYKNSDIFRCIIHSGGTGNFRKSKILFNVTCIPKFRIVASSGSGNTLYFWKIHHFALESKAMSIPCVNIKKCKIGKTWKC